MSSHYYHRIPDFNNIIDAIRPSDNRILNIFEVLAFNLKLLIIPTLISFISLVRSGSTLILYVNIQQICF